MWEGCGGVEKLHTDPTDRNCVQLQKYFFQFLYVFSFVFDVVLVFLCYLWMSFKLQVLFHVEVKR